MHIINIISIMYGTSYQVYVAGPPEILKKWVDENSVSKLDLCFQLHLFSIEHVSYSCSFHPWQEFIIQPLISK